MGDQPTPTLADITRAQVAGYLSKVGDGGVVDGELFRDLAVACVVESMTGILEGRHEIRHAGDAMLVAKTSMNMLAQLAEHLDRDDDIESMTPEQAREQLTEFSGEIRRKTGERVDE